MLFFPIVVMIPLLCLSSMLAFDEIRKVIIHGVHIEQLESIGYASWNLALAGSVLSRLPSALSQTGPVQTPLVDASLAACLFGITLLHAGRSARPIMWLQISALGLLATLGVWIVFAL